MTWLITGGTGQLGIALSRELENRGILFKAQGSEDLDITNGLIVGDLVADLSPTVIINCAAWTDVDAAEVSEQQASIVNADGAENIALAAKNSASKLIHISTDYVFSGESNNPWQVSDRLNPQSAYGRTKADGESRVLQAYGENSSIVRTAWMYSPWGKNFALTMTRRAMNGNDVVPVVIDQIGQPTSAMDLARQIVELGISSAPAGIYHGTNSGQCTWFEFAQEIFKLAGGDIKRVVPVSSNEYPRAAKRPQYSVLGHDEWAKSSVKPMRDWRIALDEAIPFIISRVKAEE
jgi:dTDP-4-dehydrorhamnose reductase